MNNNITQALLSLLNKGIVKFTYRKVDGSIRKAVGSRNLDAIRVAFGVRVPTPKTGNTNPTAYYDLEKEAWRSFKAENVLSINDIDIKEIKGVSGGRIVKVSEPTEVEIPINIGGFDTPQAEIPNFDLGKVGKLLGVDINKVAPYTQAKAFAPEKVAKDHIALPISGMPIEEFAKLVAKYVVDEFVSRIK